jgi:3-phenylpropionate/cinnamic acid dioxygenase small subunit
VDAELAARLRVVVDQQEIHDLLVRYCRGVDRRDPRLILDAFHEDASDDHGQGVASPADLARSIVGSQVPRPYMHFLGNQLIEVEGDLARAETYFISFQQRGREGRLYTRTRAGRYVDRLERRDGHWKIAHRTVVDDWNRVDEVKESLPEVPLRGGFAPDDPVYDPIAQRR